MPPSLLLLPYKTRKNQKIPKKATFAYIPPSLHLARSRYPMPMETPLVSPPTARISPRMDVVAPDPSFSFLDQMLCGDCLTLMSALPAQSVDLILTSPPYNLKNSTGNGMKKPSGLWKHGSLFAGYTHHEDCMPHADYVAWQRTCLTEMLRLLKETGAIFYNHKWRVQGGLLQDRNDIVAGFPVRQIIIWKRRGGLNFNQGYFLPTYEVLYLIAKPKFRLAPQANRYGDVWEIAQETKQAHPAPFPLALAERVISSTEAQLILDPFMGSGTTAVAAKKLGRHYVGMDSSPQYCQMAEDRIAKVGM